MHFIMMSGKAFNKRPSKKISVTNTNTNIAQAQHVGDKMKNE
jgi:hypothetical protein